MKRKIGILVLFLALAEVMVLGQISGQRVFDAKTDQLLKDGVRKLVDLYTGDLENIVSLDKRNTPENRMDIMRSALYLFRAKGDSIVTYVLDNNDIVTDSLKEDPVKTEVTSLYRDTTIVYTQKQYLARLVQQANNQVGYKISITSSEWFNMEVSHLRKVAENSYVIDVSFLQKYRRTDSDGSVILYEDGTKKRVTCHIDVIETDYGREFAIQLGDIVAIETAEYNKYDL